MEYSQSHDPSYKLEIIEMLGIDARVGIDLEGVIIVGRVLEQTVERIEHLV